MHFNVSFEVVYSGETPPASFKLADMWPLLVMGLKVSLEFVRGGKRPTTAVIRTLMWPGILCMIQEVNFEFLP